MTSPVTVLQVRSSRQLTTTALLVLLLSVAASLASACGRGGHRSDEPAPQGMALSPLEFTDNTPELLLTWVDEQGDFHVVQKPADVPAPSRERVRVVVTTRAEGTLDSVYVADLSKPTAPGSYRAQPMPRADWEQLGAARRKARLEALAPSASASAPAAQPSAAVTSGTVVLYGAAWCGACRQARRYLQERGVPVVEKDVESGEAVAKELSQKLAKAGKPPTNSIPVIDVGGQLLVGFDPRALDQALARLKSQRTL
jgi:glutaredoxin